MKKLLLILVPILLFSFRSFSQSFPYTVQPTGGSQNIRSGPGTSYSLVDGVILNNNLVANSISSGWYYVSLPSPTSALYGYGLSGSGYMQPSNLSYVTIQNTAPQGLYIRNNPAGSNITISGSNAKVWDGQSFACTGSTSIVSGSTWYQIYLTINCSQSTGWISNGAPSNNYIQYTSTASCTPVSIISNPATQTVNTGNSATLSTSVSGTPPYSYTWYKNGSYYGSTPSTNSTTDVVSIGSASTSDAGNYYCVVTNCSNTSSVQSNTATLSINSPSTTTINVSGFLAFGNIQVGSTSSPLNLTITNTGSATLNVTSLSYSNSAFAGNWSGAIGVGQSQTVPITFSPTSATTYNGTITVNSNATNATNILSCTGTGTASTSAPVANFTVSSQNINTGATITTTNTSTGSPTPTYQWTSNPNTGVTISNATSINPNITFTNSGSYTISVTATNSAGTNTANKVISVNNNNVTITTIANPLNGGSTTGSNTYVIGSNVTISANPFTGYTFYRWMKNGSQVSTNAVYNFTASSTETYSAEFTVIPPNNYSISTNSNPIYGGTTNGGGVYATGTNITLTAIPNTGFNFLKWTNNGSDVSTNPNYSFNVSSNQNYQAEFTTVSQITYNINTSSNPTNGGITTGGGNNIPYGTNITLTATSNSGFNFQAWKENGTIVNTNKSFSFQVANNRNLVADFNEISEDYKLPFPIGLTYECTQGNNENCKGCTHKSSSNDQFAFDFKLSSQDVCASKSGKIVKVQDKYGNSGCAPDANGNCLPSGCAKEVNYIVIDHHNGEYSWYLHLTKGQMKVKEGDEVSQGEVIALSGKSGCITGFHLHYMVAKSPNWYPHSIQTYFCDFTKPQRNGIPQEFDLCTSSTCLPIGGGNSHAFEAINTFQIIPNPNIGNFILLYSQEGTKTGNIQIYNCLGSSIYKEKINLYDGDNQFPINIDFMPKGIYIIKLSTDSKTQIAKFIVE